MSELLAALDFGSNSVKILVAEPAAGGFHEQLEATRVTRLAGSVARTGRLQPEAVRQTLAALDEFLHMIPAGSRGRGIAAATSAVRDAADGAAFLDQVAARLGAPPHLFSGHEEADTVFDAVAGGFPPGTPVVCVDAGGGSTEVAAGVPGACAFRTSLQLGCVRDGEHFALLEAATPTDALAAHASIRGRIVPAAAEVLRTRAPDAPPHHVVASGGTAASLARVLLRLPQFNREKIHGLRVTLQEIETLAARLLPMTCEQRRREPGMPFDRAAVLPTGLLILQETLRALGARELTVSCRGLRHGLLLRLLEGSLAPTWTW